MNVRFRTTFLVALTQLQCGGGSDSDDNITFIPRQGSRVLNIAATDFEGSPVISADGGTVLFTSGRTGERRIFKKIVGEELVRLAEIDADEEIEAKISGNAEIAVVRIRRGDQVDLLLQPLAAGSSGVAITDNKSVELDFDLHPSGSAVVYSAAGENSDGKCIYVRTIEQSGDAWIIGAELTVQDCSTDWNEVMPIWSEEPGRFILATHAASGTEAGGLLIRNAATVEELVQLEPTVVALPEDLVQIGSAAVFSTEVAFVRTVAAGENLKRPPSIEEGRTSDLQLPVESLASSVALTGGEATDFPMEGFAITGALSTNQLGTSLVYLEQRRYSCRDLADRYATVLTLANRLNQTQLDLVPVYNPETEIWAAVSQPCESLRSSTKSVDFNIISAALNADATSSEFSVVYTSRFANRDGDFGNPEIRLIRKEASNDSFQVISISENSAL